MNFYNVYTDPLDVNPHQTTWKTIKNVPLAFLIIVNMSNNSKLKKILWKGYEYKRHMTNVRKFTELNQGIYIWSITLFNNSTDKIYMII